MPEAIIRNGRVETDSWTLVGVETAGELPQPLPAGPVVVPLAWWKAQRAVLAHHAAPVGVWLAPSEDPGDLAADVAGLPLIAVHFPKFTDGRGYSTAALLRGRYDFKGELRAFGDVGRDQLFYLKRCGFDSFALAPHRDPAAALAGLADFSLRYQGSIDDPEPLFAKRRATSLAQ